MFLAHEYEVCVFGWSWLVPDIAVAGIGLSPVFFYAMVPESVSNLHWLVDCGSKAAQKRLTVKYQNLLVGDFLIGFLVGWGFPSGKSAVFRKSGRSILLNRRVLVSFAFSLSKSLILSFRHTP